VAAVMLRTTASSQCLWPSFSIPPKPDAALYDMDDMADDLDFDFELHVPYVAGSGGKIIRVLCAVALCSIDLVETGM
jgi:hypothetical protein